MQYASGGRESHFSSNNRKNSFYSGYKSPSFSQHMQMGLVSYHMGQDDSARDQQAYPMAEINGESQQAAGDM